MHPQVRVPRITDHVLRVQPGPLRRPPPSQVHGMGQLERGASSRRLPDMGLLSGGPGRSAVPGGHSGVRGARAAGQERVSLPHNRGEQQGLCESGVGSFVVINYATSSSRLK